MNQEINDKLMQYLGSLEGAVETAIDFSKEQAPQVIRELVEYTIAYNGLIVGLSAAVIMLSLLVNAVVILARNKLCKNEPGLPVAISLIVSAFTVVPALTVLSNCLPDLMKAWFAPRLFVLEYIADMVT